MLRSAPLDAPAQHCHRHSNTNDQCRCTCLPIDRRHGQAQRTKRPPRRPNTKSLHEGSDPLPSTKQVRICNGTASNTSCAAVSLRTVPQKLNDSPSNVAIRRQEQEQDPGSSSSAMREHPTVTPQAPESQSARKGSEHDRSLETTPLRLLAATPALCSQANPGTHRGSCSCAMREHPTVTPQAP